MSRPTLGPLPRAGLPLRVGSRGACFSVMATMCGRAGMNGPVGYASSLLGVWGRQGQLRSPFGGCKASRSAEGQVARALLQDW